MHDNFFQIVAMISLGIALFLLLGMYRYAKKVKKLLRLADEMEKLNAENKRRLDRMIKGDSQR